MILLPAAACSALLAECHKVIDESPDEVLSQENFEELSSREVAALASRNQLRLIHEGSLFDALDKWSAAECRRQGLEPTAANRRSALSDNVWYSVRYLLMSSSEFIDGPMHSGILSGEELSVISSKILHHDHGQTTEQVSSLKFIIFSVKKNDFSKIKKSKDRTFEKSKNQITNKSILYFATA